MLPHLFDHLLGEVCPAVEHRHDDALDAPVRVGAREPDLFLHVDDLRQAFEPEKLALQGDEQFVGGGQRRGHQHPEGGRTIQKDVVVDRRRPAAKKAPPGAA